MNLFDLFRTKNGVLRISKLVLLLRTSLVYETESKCFYYRILNREKIGPEKKKA